jgi:hypothetical protein
VTEERKYKIGDRVCRDDGEFPGTIIAYKENPKIYVIKVDKDGTGQRAHEDNIKLIEKKPKYLDIVFDGPPSHESGRFVEVEDIEGRSIRADE